VGIVTVVAVQDGDTTPPPRAERDDACTPSVSGDGADVGDPAPAFALPGLDGGCVRMDAPAGAPTIVNFWASWCNPCRREFPMLEEAYDEHRGDGLEVVGVTYRDIDDDARAFADAEEADWPLAHDEDEIVAKAYGVNTIPQTFFVDARGRVTGHVFGTLTKRDLDTELEKILAP